MFKLPSLKKPLSKGTILSIITFVLGTIIALILGLFVSKDVGMYVEAVVALFSLAVIFITETLKEELKEELKGSTAITIPIQGMEKICELRSKIKTKRFIEAFDDAIDSLKEGKIKLNEKEMLRFWSELHTPNDIIFFRCTSSINPDTWNNTYMRQYERRQIGNIKEYDLKIKEEKEKYMRIIGGALSGVEINGHNFERIFIVNDDQLKDEKLLDEIAQRIHQQLPFMTIKVVRTSEISSSDYEDFGIIINEKGDKFVMYLEIMGDRKVGGGWVSFDNEVIGRYMRAYKTIQHICPTPIKKGVSIENIKRIIREAELSGEDIFTNRCLQCYKETEDTLKSNEWRNLPLAQRIWYQINDDENKAIIKILNKTKPKKVLEVGCGYGRVIQLMFDSYKTCEKIVGIEQNKEIYEHAYERFDKPEFEKVVIMQRLIEKSVGVPFDDDYFDLCIDSSNLVGWQEDETEWLKEMIRVSKTVYFSVYKKGKERERKNMYGTRPPDASIKDIVEIDDNQNIILKNVDAFGGESHMTKSYTKECIKEILEKVYKCIPIDYDIDSTSCDFMFFCTLHKRN